MPIKINKLTKELLDDWMFFFDNETFTDRLKEANIEVSDRLQIGPTIGTHIGPEAYGIVYVAE